MAPIKFSVATPGVTDQLMGFYRWKLELVAGRATRTCNEYESIFLPMRETPRNQAAM